MPAETDESTVSPGAYCSATEALRETTPSASKATRVSKDTPLALKKRETDQVPAAAKTDGATDAAHTKANRRGPRQIQETESATYVADALYVYSGSLILLSLLLIMMLLF